MIIRSDEWKRKQSLAHKGKKLSDERKKQISIYQKTHPNSGQFKKGEERLLRSKSVEHKKKISIAHMGKPKSFNRGAGNFNWKNGISKLCEKIRKYQKYDYWRTNVFRRDGFTCLNCGKRGGDLEAHHINPFAHILFEKCITNLDQAMDCKELWDVDNGVTLCIPCHRLTF